MKDMVDELHSLRVDELHSLRIPFDGPHRAGQTDVSVMLRDEFAADVPYPGESKEMPSGLTETQEGQWTKLVVACTLLDSMYLLDSSYSRAKVFMWGAAHRYVPMVETCDAATLEAVHADLEVRWGQFGGRREDTHLTLSTYPDFVRYALARAALNPNATDRMMWRVFDFPETTTYEISSILDRCPPDDIWEHVLFDLRWDVSDYRDCPAHLSDLYPVVT